MNQTELARELGVSQKTVAYHANGLSITAKGKGRRESYSLSEIISISESIKKSRKRGTRGAKVIVCGVCGERGHSETLCLLSPKLKTCTKCRVEKPRGDFSTIAWAKNRIGSWCKV